MPQGTDADTAVAAANKAMGIDAQWTLEQQVEVLQVSRATEERVRVLQASVEAIARAVALRTDL